MTFRVFWSPHAEQRLEQLVLGASEPVVLAAVAREIDQRLGADPKAFGESRFDTAHRFNGSRC